MLECVVKFGLRDRHLFPRRTARPNLVYFGAINLWCRQVCGHRRFTGDSPIIVEASNEQQVLFTGVLACGLKWLEENIAVAGHGAGERLEIHFCEFVLADRRRSDVPCRRQRSRSRYPTSDRRCEAEPRFQITEDRRIYNGKARPPPCIRIACSDVETAGQSEPYALISSIYSASGSDLPEKIFARKPDRPGSAP